MDAIVDKLDLSLWSRADGIGPKAWRAGWPFLVTLHVLII